MSLTVVGARWWKVDFHTHTPASNDYGKGPNQAALKLTTPEEWLLDYMRAGIDGVVVTDHNSGDWIDLLKDALVSDAVTQDADFRPLVIFPGIELTANGGTHVLAIFDPSAGTEDVTALLGRCEFDLTKKGTSDRACPCSVEVAVRKIAEAGAVPILAHVDIPTGAFVDLKGNTLSPLTDLEELYAYEMRDKALPLPPDIAKRVSRWTQVLGSDAHHRDGTQGPRFPGSHYTWLKLEKLDLEGMKLALLDGNGLSVYRSDDGIGDPNIVPDLWIERINVSRARIMGNGRNLQSSFSPKLNTLIGGRGTGKSTLLEFMRMAFDRSEELPATLQSDFDAFFGKRQLVAGQGAYRPDTKVKLIIWKDGRRLSLEFEGGSTEPKSYYWDGANWVESVGSIQSRFPVSIYSQKQVYNMANDRFGLLKRIDERPEVRYDEWRQEFDFAVAAHSDIRARIRALRQRLATRAKLQGELDDTKRKLEVFERMGHEVILKEHALREGQHSALVETYRGLQSAHATLSKCIEELVQPDVVRTSFDGTKKEDAEALALLNEADKIWKALGARLAEAAENLANETREWNDRVKGSDTIRLRAAAKKKYDDLAAALVQQGVANLQQYGPLVQRRAQLEKALKELAALPELIRKTEETAQEQLSVVCALRQEITNRRGHFVREHIQASEAVKIRVSPYSLDPKATEQQWRELLARSTTMAEPFLTADGSGGMIGELYDGVPDDPEAARVELEKRIADLKREVLEIVQGGNPKNRQAWLLTYFRSLPPETLDRIPCWWPEDNLEIDYAVGQGRVEYKPIQNGSPGQKTAGILAFLLAFGNEPMILDQPEDDLDNQLIYDLIVSQLRENKKRRQVIIVTHNPNIVVNGDAEYVIPLDYRSGQSVIVDPPGPGSLQSRAIRDEVCRVMEGGRAAFSKRYRRLALEGVHV